MEFEISTPRYSFSSSEQKRNIRYPATEQMQYKWRKFVIKDQESKLRAGLPKLCYLDQLHLCDCWSLCTSPRECTHRAFPKCITVSVECGSYPGSLHILSWSRCISAPVCPPCSFPPLLQRNLSFSSDCCAPVSLCSSQWVLWLLCCPARGQMGLRCKGGVSPYRNMALPCGNGFHHEKELNSHVSSSLISTLCVTTLFSPFLLTFTGELPSSCVF